MSEVHDLQQPARPLCIIDGSNLARRAFHAGSSLGVVNAAKKIRAMYLELYAEDVEVVAAWDGAPPTWRHTLWPKYKAHRERNTEAIRAVRQDFKAARAAGIVGILAKGGEADDAAATVARRAVQRRRTVILVSSDKDWGQLMSKPRVVWVSPVKGGELEDRQEDWFLDRYGIMPSEWPDYVGLAGDATDGIPGVPGVGPKKAIKLLTEHGSLDAIIAAGLLTPEDQELAEVSRKLARLDAESQIDWQDDGG